MHRHVKNRLTHELHLGNLHFYVKRHLGCGWGEALKEWYRFRKSVVSARTEWEGAATLAAAGVRVPKVLGKGERGCYPHAIESFVVLDALEDCETLKHLKDGWMDTTGSRFVAIKRALIDEVASMGRTMHGQGINHRDFYINHFLINRDLIRNWHPSQPIPLNLIDLHRVQHRPSVPHRWLIKDLASLLFSALDVGLTSADCSATYAFTSAPTGKRLCVTIPNSGKRSSNEPASSIKVFTENHPPGQSFLKLNRQLQVSAPAQQAGMPVPPSPLHEKRLVQPTLRKYESPTSDFR